MAGEICSLLESQALCLYVVMKDGNQNQFAKAEKFSKHCLHHQEPQPPGTSTTTTHPPAHLPTHLPTNQPTNQPTKKKKNKTNNRNKKKKKSVFFSLLTWQLVLPRKWAPTDGQWTDGRPPPLPGRKFHRCRCADHHAARVIINIVYQSYCWWTKSCTTKDDDYPIIYRVLTIPGGAGVRPSTVFMFILHIHHHRT